MKTIMKHVIPLVLILVMCVSMAAPAFAMDSPWYGHIRNFPQVTNGSSGGAVLALQHFLGRYSYSTYKSLGANGCDGVFGNATRSALTAFQTATLGSSAADGICGPNTWGKVADKLSKYSRVIDFGYYMIFTCSNYNSPYSENIFRATVTIDAGKALYGAYNSSGTITGGSFYSGSV